MCESLREFRESKGVSAVDAAEALDMGVEEYETLECHVGSMDLEQAYLLSLLLGCTLSDLFRVIERQMPGRETMATLDRIRRHRRSCPETRHG